MSISIVYHGDSILSRDLTNLCRQSLPTKRINYTCHTFFVGSGGPYERLLIDINS